MHVDWPRVALRFRGAWRMLLEYDWTAGVRWNRVVHEHALWVVWNGEGFLSALAASAKEATKPEQHRLTPGACFWTRPGQNYFAEQRGPERLGLAFVHFDLRDAEGRMLRHGDALPPLALPHADTAYLNDAVHKLVEFDELRAWSALPAKIFGKQYKEGRHPYLGEKQPRRDAGALLPESAGSRLALARQGTPEHWARAAEAQLRALLMDLDARSALPVRGARPLKMHEKTWRVRDLARRMQANPGELPRMDEVAMALQLSQQRMFQIFREEIGMAPHRYLLFARARQAMHRLRVSSQPAYRVMRELGFRNKENFTRVFALFAGCAPRPFRTRAEREADRERRADREAQKRKKEKEAKLPTVRARFKKPRKKKAHAKARRRKGAKDRR